LAFRLRAMRLSAVMRVVRKLGLPALVLGRGGQFPEPDPKVLSRLRAAFVPEVEAIDKMTGRDLSHWK
jgi:hypothetical protein